MNIKLAVISVVIILIVVATFFQQKTKSTPTAPYTTKISVGEKTMFVEVVTTKEAMAQGLSGREKLLQNQGMIFDYGRGASIRPGFWMPDMKFNIDIIWIKENIIIGITKNVQAPVKDERLRIKDTSLPIYYPPSSVDMVLEVNAGGSEGVQVGERIIFK